MGTVRRQWARASVDLDESGANGSPQIHKIGLPAVVNGALGGQREFRSTC
jgi:hypothetical protein